MTLFIQAELENHKAKWTMQSRAHGATIYSLNLQVYCFSIKTNNIYFSQIKGCPYLIGLISCNGRKGVVMDMYFNKIIFKHFPLTDVSINLSVFGGTVVKGSIIKLRTPCLIF